MLGSKLSSEMFELVKEPLPLNNEGFHHKITYQVVNLSFQTSPSLLKTKVSIFCTHRVIHSSFSIFNKEKKHEWLHKSQFYKKLPILF